MAQRAVPDLKRCRVLALALSVVANPDVYNLDVIEALVAANDPEAHQHLLHAAFEHFDLSPARMTNMLVTIANTGASQTYSVLLGKLEPGACGRGTRRVLDSLDRDTLRQILAMANEKVHAAIADEIGPALGRLLAPASGHDTDWLIQYLQARVALLAEYPVGHNPTRYAFGYNGDLEFVRAHPGYEQIMIAVLASVPQGRRDVPHLLCDSIGTAILRGSRRGTDEGYTFDPQTLSILLTAVRYSAEWAQAVMDILFSAGVLRNADRVWEEVVQHHPQLVTHEWLFAALDAGSESGSLSKRYQQTKQRLEALGASTKIPALKVLCARAVLLIANQRIDDAKRSEAIESELRDWDLPGLIERILL